MGLWIYLNGEYVSEEEAKISVFDHGFLYGDGVFEGLMGGRSLNWRNTSRGCTIRPGPLP